MRIFALTFLPLVACIDDTGEGKDAPPEQSALGAVDGSTEVEWTYIIGEEERLTDPRDLGFDAEGNLWIANREDDRTFIVSNPGTPEQDHERRKDAAANHFMEETAALSFDDDSQFGSCGETRNTYDDAASPNDFMGPVLWSADLEVFAEQNPEGLGSHLDMLHQSPYCVGIAWERDNVYWAFDGKNDNIVRYDFASDHGIGQDDHANGIVDRLTEFEVARVEGAPSHMMVDPESGILYVADTGNGRVLWIDTATGESGDALRARNEPLAEYSEWVDVDWGVLVEGLDEPGGLALDGEYLYVAEYATGILHAFTKDGEAVSELDSGRGGTAIYGIEIGPDGALWVVDNSEPAVYRLEP
ncbi:MAG: hypothetical protein Q8P41_30205 [Pseudomonadota bacterium]|nr:hypothetical protein [Pseudomonadota bacterium]